MTALLLPLLLLLQCCGNKSSAVSLTTPAFTWNHGTQLAATANRVGRDRQLAHFEILKPRTAAAFNLGSVDGGSVSYLAAKTHSDQYGDLPFRIGHGYDLHRLSYLSDRATGPLILSGVVCGDTQKRADYPLGAFGRLVGSAAAALLRLQRRGPSVWVVAHSDGDAVLHAVADAIFGAVGSPDIGQLFPDDNPRNKNRSSVEFIKAATAAAAARRYKVAQVDVTIVLETPKISKKKGDMMSVLANSLEIPVSRVNIKAKTGEGVGPVGRGEAVECHSVVLLQRID